jgi:hypothetical protein
MRFRKLRIVWSVACGLLAVLLVVLCVRSYWWSYMPIYRRGQTIVAVGAVRGIACFHWRTWQPFVTVGNPLGWDLVGGAAETMASGLKPVEWRRDTDPSTVSALFVSVPCWYCVTVLATLVAVPWLRYRFSLRTLLIATTLVAMVLGLIVWMSQAS